MKIFLLFLFFMSLTSQAFGALSWADQIGLQRKDARIFPAQSEPMNEAELLRERVCVELTPTAESEATCLGIPFNQFSAARHGICINYARSSSAYLVCMYNIEISGEEVAQCWSDATTEVTLVSCLLQSPELETEQEILDEILSRFPNIKLVPPISTPYEEEAEVTPWSEA